MVTTDCQMFSLFFIHTRAQKFPNYLLYTRFRKYKTIVKLYETSWQDE